MGSKQVNGWIPEGGLGFEGGDEEDGAGDEQESRDNNLCKLESGALTEAMHLNVCPVTSDTCTSDIRCQM